MTEVPKVQDAHPDLTGGIGAESFIAFQYVRSLAIDHGIPLNLEGQKQDPIDSADLIKQPPCSNLIKQLLANLKKTGQLSARDMIKLAMVHHMTPPKVDPIKLTAPVEDAAESPPALQTAALSERERLVSRHQDMIQQSDINH